MQFFRFGVSGQERPGVIFEQRAFDLSPLTYDLDPAFIGSGGLDEAANAARAGDLAQVQLDGERLGAPIRNPGSIVCIGMNYAAHAQESGSSVPEEPVVFFKHPSSVVGPFDDVHVPRGSTHTDWEVELGVVIGTRCRYLASESDALKCIAGYVLSNDVSERVFQLEGSGGQWSKGKSCETFNPLGPYLVRPSDIGDPQDLRLRSFVNGEARQDSSTADMIFSVSYLIWYLSQYMVLLPGDVVNTGTPEGVALSGRFPYLQAGDVMSIEIEGLGRQQQGLVVAP